LVKKGGTKRLLRFHAAADEKKRERWAGTKSKEGGGRHKMNQRKETTGGKSSRHGKGHHKDRIDPGLSTGKEDNGPPWRQITSERGKEKGNFYGSSIAKPEKGGTNNARQTGTKGHSTK